jgi:tRNA threonylcarbamoyl adenosine modification protein YeaZ
MTTILALDTTSKYASIAVGRDEKIELEYNFATHDELSSSLIPSVEFVLNSVSPALKPDDIDVYGIATGPGLFTGIRVGLATLKGLTLEAGKPVVPVVTLEALAYKYNESESPVIAMIDARREEVYIAAYRFTGKDRIAEQLLPPALIGIDTLPQHLEPLGKQDRLRFIGSGAEAHKTFIREHFTTGRIYRRSYFLASEICKITARKHKNKEYITDMQQLMPFYIRKPDAEQNLARKKKKTGV